MGSCANREVTAKTPQTYANSGSKTNIKLAQ